MKNFLTIIVLLVSLTSWSNDYYQAKIILKDGKTLEGYATLPMNKMWQNSLKYKTDKNAEKEKIKYKKIAEAYYYVDGKEYFFTYSKVVWDFKSTENYHKKSFITRDYWAFAVDRDPKLNVYYLASHYFVNDKGEMVARPSVYNTKGLEAIFVLYKRPSEIYPFHITTYFRGANRYFRNLAMRYFADTPSLVQRIKNKEFRNTDFDKLAEAYIKNQ